MATHRTWTMRSLRLLLLLEDVQASALVSQMQQIELLEARDSNMTVSSLRHLAMSPSSALDRLPARLLQLQQTPNHLVVVNNLNRTMMRTFPFHSILTTSISRKTPILQLAHPGQKTSS